MNRIIKFRAWDKDDSKMYLVDKLTTLEWITWIQKAEGKGNYELMQFTGLKDKNGKEIYEGDIIQIPDYAKPETFMVVVEWRDTGCYNVNSDALHLIEIIGNVWEHPELIK